jgi:lipase maturation factor 1
MPDTSRWCSYIARPFQRLTTLFRPQGASLARPYTYVLASWAFLRLLGMVYVIAFGSLWLQLDGLSGHEGIVPVAPLLAAAQHRLGLERWWQFPTLCWLDASDGFLYLLCGLGVGLGILVMLGLLPALNLLVLWALYLSFATVCQPWLGFQWDNLLLETGFLSVWLAPLTLHDRLRRAVPPSPLALWSLRWLLIRLMFASGVVKLSSEDATWRDLTALVYHYETQPLPTWIGWYAHQLPMAWQRASTLIMFGIELVIPWLILAPRRLRLTACGCLVALQLLIAATGNYGIFNLLTLLLCLLLCDDAVWPHAWRARLDVTPFPATASAEGAQLNVPPFPASATAEGRQLNGAPSSARPRHWPAWSIAPIVLVIFIMSLIQTMGSFRWHIQWPRPIPQVASWIAPFRTVNSYGLFAVMTTSRPEIIVEGSNDGQTWLPYAFPWKPGDVMRRPGFVAPYMPRLDWQMWFVALGSAQYQPWFRHFVERLLQGTPAVVGLLAHNPFPHTPPRYIRAVVYTYHFTDRATRQTTGAWWRRERQGLYMPVMSLRR